MAGLKRRASQVWPELHGEQAHGLYSLHRMFDIGGDVCVLSFLFVDVIDDHERGLIRNGRDVLLALERQDRCEESNFRQVLQLLCIITRHDLMPYVTLKRRRAVCPDLVDKYLEETSVRYVTPRALSDPEPRPPHPPKTVPPHYPVTLTEQVLLPNFFNPNSCILSTTLFYRVSNVHAPHEHSVLELDGHTTLPCCKRPHQAHRSGTFPILSFWAFRLESAPGTHAELPSAPVPMRSLPQAGWQKPKAGP
ncbi:hypothetical protein Celaphus_00011831 [Cervus elaphus hippelaphus]|uniref:DED domain-containing protein n=1 Tax=Cervus elaphus hippelaphus TaxID=46360 RepID=A0A212CKD9_CEREH|nr:hypothetical protein Celaphus_00011831 [Cervus elaphus hippelaphus]